MRITDPLGQSVPSGHGDPVDTRAAMKIVRKDLPSPGMPTSNVILPSGTRSGHSHLISAGSTSAKHIRIGRSTTSLRFTVGASSTKPSTMARRVSGSMASWASSQSQMSPFWSSSGRSTSLTFRAGSSFARMDATSLAYRRPAASLSGRITTSRPASGVQPALAALLLPCGLVVASRPIVIADSTAFSPSAT